MSNQLHPTSDSSPSAVSASSADQKRVDHELIQAVAAGCEDSLTCLMDQYAGLVFHVCKRICSDEAEVTSLVSEVFFETWKRASTYRADRGSVKTFILLIARSRAIDWQRSKKARKLPTTPLEHLATSEMPEDAPSPTYALIQQEDFAKTREAMRALQPEQRQAIEFAFFQGRTHTEVANLMDAPLGTTKSRIRSGLRALRQIVAPECEAS